MTQRPSNSSSVNSKVSKSVGWFVEVLCLNSSWNISFNGDSSFMTISTDLKVDYHLVTTFCKSLEALSVTAAMIKSFSSPQMSMSCTSWLTIFVPKALAKFKHPPPHLPQHAPRAWTAPVYEQKTQHATEDHSPFLNKAETTRVSQFWYLSILCKGCRPHNPTCS